jgi:hypothetical protein
MHFGIWRNDAGVTVLARTDAHPEMPGPCLYRFEAATWEAACAVYHARTPVPAADAWRRTREPARRPRHADPTRGARGLPPCPPGYLCEVCLDAPAVAFVPAPWGGEMGVCAVCGGLPPPEPDEDATASGQHGFDTGHPRRPGAVRIRPGVRINLRA